MSQSEAGTELSQELGLQIKESGTTLQLCSWHSAQADHKRLVIEGYPETSRKLLKNLILAWIKPPTIELLEKGRGELLAKLRPKEQDYLLGYYLHQERQFIYAYNNQLSNLSVNSTQRSELSHVPMKEIISKSTPINIVARRICEEIKIQQDNERPESWWY